MSVYLKIMFKIKNNISIMYIQTRFYLYNKILYVLVFLKTNKKISTSREEIILIKFFQGFLIQAQFRSTARQWLYKNIIQIEPI